MPDNKPMFFYIFPRTSSTSLTQYLRDSFGDDQVFAFKVIEEFHEGMPINADTPAPSLLRLRKQLQTTPPKKAYVIMAPYGVHNWLPVPVNLFTTLRAPVDRCVSLLNFMRAKSELNPINRLVASFGNDIDSIMACQDVLCFSNEQTRMLSGAIGRTVTENDLEQALQNLSRFQRIFRFGDYEFLSSVVTNAGATAQHYPHLNSVPSAAEFYEEKFLDVLAEANRHDQILYDAILPQESYV